jgi:hypothetical protein
LEAGLSTFLPPIYGVCINAGYATGGIFTESLVYANSFCAILFTMEPERVFWTRWAQGLQRWGLMEPAAAVLDAAGPLNVVFAQLLYAAAPIFQSEPSNNSWQALGQVLEDHHERRSFTAFLRREEVD